ncbi:MAG TPA: hypothetical protein VN154_09600 [Rhizomicrobium sp.]|nr:hypothetical protein [Rhizomicrobium sp.]
MQALSLSAKENLAMPDNDQADGGLQNSPDAARENPTSPGGQNTLGLCHEVEQFIADKPLKALAIAFLAGVVISRIIL